MKDTVSELRIYNNRLAQFKEWKNTSRDWEEYWRNHPISKVSEIPADRDLEEFEPIFEKYIPKKLPVLEAGCGNGKVILPLSTKGYQLEGVDFSIDTITNLKNLAPQLNLHVGDIYHLSSIDNYYGAYISIGVLEHDPSGPTSGLNEAWRVLTPDGYAFISVPYLNKHRRKILNSIKYPNRTMLNKDLDFYQYYYSSDDFALLLNQAKFELVEMCPYGVYAGITRDFRFWFWLKQHHFFSWRLKNYFLNFCMQAPSSIRWRYAHMLMFICKPIGK